MGSTQVMPIFLPVLQVRTWKCETCDYVVTVRLQNIFFPNRWRNLKDPQICLPLLVLKFAMLNSRRQTWRLFAKLSVQVYHPMSLSSVLLDHSFCTRSGYFLGKSLACHQQTFELGCDGGSITRYARKRERISWQVRTMQSIYWWSDSMDQLLEKTVSLQRCSFFAQLTRIFRIHISTTFLEKIKLPQLQLIRQ